MPNPLQDLTELLGSSQLRPVVKLDRLGASAVYDLQYRLFVIACSFMRHAKTELHGIRQIQSARLKLIQFTASRPWLLAHLVEWSKSRRDPQRSLLSSQRFRRAFLGDTTHDDVIAFLFANDVLRPHGSSLRSGSRDNLLSQLNDIAASSNLFEAERKVLETLTTVRITNDMLEGW